jgi:membrane-anchored protein YejM (alkaline phosphatase superfamily)
MKRISLIAAALLSTTLCITHIRCSRGVEKPNVLLVSIDTLRADHVHPYGYEKETSPFLDSLARQGVLFKNAIAQANWTLPSHASIFTSLYPAVHRVQRQTEKMGDTLETMAEMLKAAGYDTAAFVDGGVLGSGFGFSQGFDLYDDRSLGTQKDRRVVKWLREHRTHPFLLVYHTYDVHFPYVHHPHPRDFKDDPELEDIARRINAKEYDLTDEEFAKAVVAWCTYRDFYKMIDADRLSLLKEQMGNFFKERWPRMPSFHDDLRYLIEAYDSGISFFDNRLRKLWKEVRDMGLDKNTVLIVTSDHGECFLEHGALGHPELLYDEIVRVPLIIVYPPLEAEGLRVEAQVMTIDILPTILDCIKTAQPPQLQGHSLLPLINGRGTRPERPAFADAFENSCIRTGGWKYIHRDRFEMKKSDQGGDELYDLENDPLEKRNLVDADITTRNDLEKALRDWEEMNSRLRKNLGLDRLPEKVKLDKATTERLRALGYLQ